MALSQKTHKQISKNGTFLTLLPLSMPVFLIRLNAKTNLLIMKKFIAFPRKKLHLSVLITCIFLSASLAAQQGWSRDFKAERAFIENKGQFYVRSLWGEQNHVLYGFDGSFSRIFLKENGVTFNFTKKSPREIKEHHKENYSSAEEMARDEQEEHSAVLELDEVSYFWANSNPHPQIITEGESGAYFNYSFKVNNKERSENYIKGYSKIIYKDI